MNPVTSYPIDQNWKFKLRDKSLQNVLDEDSSQASSVTAFPSEVYAELLAGGSIPHPYKLDNEHRLKWIGDEEWVYATQVPFKPTPGHSHVELIFEGLDTNCTVYWNSVPILEADNMLLPYKVQLTSEVLKPVNDLLLHFKSSKAIAKDLEAKYGKVRAGSCNLGDPSRVYSRKAQYHWRWDWGPEMMTVGPWKPIRLHTYQVAIDSFDVRASVSPDLEPSLFVSFDLKGEASDNLSIQYTVKDANQQLVKSNAPVQLVDSVRTASMTWQFQSDEVELWWPVGYGKQPLYTVEMSLVDNGVVIDTRQKRVGFRRVQLVQDPLLDEPGTSFYFKINNVPIFMQGSNWIPADTMLTTITPERYRAWLNILVEGNQNMVRVWSGGIYEPDIFYDTCDELGILVWQDMCGFACGIYPIHDSYVAQVKAEVEENVKILRHHPSIVLWCGNNEDYQQILQWGEKNLPARLFYEQIFPEIISRLTGPGQSEVPYWPGSPYGGKEWYETTDQTIGDVHEWHVWCAVAPGEYYQNYDILAGRFISEFGLPAMPDMRTIKYWLDHKSSDPSELPHPQSPLIAQHCKAGSFERRFATYMSENFRMTDNLEAYAYLTQMMQSEGLSFAYRSWRRRWKGPGREYSAGVLVWQINDSWPVTSWALVDYFMRKKPSFYTIARELKPFTVGISRMIQKDRDNDRPRQFYEFGAFRNRSATYEVWCTNSTLEERTLSLETSFYDLESQRIIQQTTGPVTLAANQSTEIISATRVLCPPRVSTSSGPYADRLTLSDEDGSYSVVIHCRLVDPSSGEVLSRFSNWPEPLKYIDFSQDPGLTIKSEQLASGDGATVTVSTKLPVKGLRFTFPSDETDDEGVDTWKREPKWSDNALDVFPGDEQKVVVQNLQGRRKILAARMGAEKGEVIDL